MTHVTIDKDLVSLGIENVVLAILPSDTLSPLLESLDGRLGPPIPESSCIVSSTRLLRLFRLTMFIVLGATVVEGVSQFVSSDSAERSVLEMLGPFVAIKGRLEDTSGEDDLSIRWTVVRIDSLSSQSG